MNDKKSALNDAVLALSSTPLELHANVVYEICRVIISRIDGNLSQLENESELIHAPDKRLELIENIYSELGEIKDILWAAVDISNSGNYKK